ncbi:metal ABC transporter permease [Cyanobacterium stanieri LEGE 03274]|uniref:Metal ABC transporter permease n=1 Tax=Cyanobacterium stanieri LEGE 03274 TaxID=1828756 RepID=A0ABR9V9B8_9CHRO|nr:metal ABC transporter permease [Cyanobacterium stanieri]MBE9223444.1 metal ABC transporter permease [Cyanobacterium stanieri LEGE 03274]
MLDFLLEPLSFGFIRNSMVMIVLLGVLCSITGSFLIVQRMVFFGEVIAHAVLPGLAIAFYVGIDLFIGAFISGMLSSLIIAWIQSQSRVKVDVAMSLVFSGFLALGILLISVLQSRIDLHSFLFGDILGITVNDLWRTFFITISVLIFVKLFYPHLLFYTFNPLGAQAIGLPVQWINLGLVSVTTLAIIASMQAVGVLLVVSLLVGPAITAYLLVKELHQMIILGAILGGISGILGIYISYYLNAPSGAAIVLVVTVLFLFAFLFSPKEGVLTRPQFFSKPNRLIRHLVKIKK